MPDLDSAPSIFVGRRQELGLLAALLQGTRPAAVLLRGEAGIGKSALVQELTELAAGRGLTVLRSSCYHIKEAGPYIPLRQLLAQAAGDPRSREGRLEALAAGVAPRNGAKSADPGEMRGRIAAAVGEALLGDTAGRPTVLTIEDLHWADLSTLLTVNYLLDARQPDLHLVFTLREGEDVDADQRELLQRISQRSEVLRLRGLSAEDVRALLNGLAPGLPLSQTECEDLRLLTSGNPLLVRELFLHLREGSLLERHSLGDAARRARVPADLGALIDARLAGLERGLLTTLKLCSAFGASFTLDDIAAAAGPDADVETDVERAQQRGLLVELDGVATSRFRFAHPLFASRLYDSLSIEERRASHRRIADTCHDLPVEELARHYALGYGELAGPTGLELCRQAAEQAEQVAAQEVAARYWELAIRCTRRSDTRERAELYRRLGDSLHTVGKWAQAVEARSESARLFRQAGCPEDEAAVALALGDLHRWRQELGESERWLKRAADLFPEATPEWAKATALRGSIRCLLQDHSSGLRLLEDAVARSAKTDGFDPKAGYWLSYGFLTAGDQDRAYSFAKEAFMQAVEQDRSTARSLLARTLLAHELGRLDAASAADYLREVEQAAGEDDPMSAVRRLVARAYYEAYCGQWRRVADICEAEMGQIRLIGPYQLASVRALWAEAQLALGNYQTAKDGLVRALPGLREMRPLGGVHLARVEALADDVVKAGSLVTEFAEATLARATPAGRAVLGDVVSRLSTPDLWRRCYEVLAGERRPLVILYSPVSVNRVRGRLASRLGNWTAAFDHFETALAELEAGGALGELANACSDYAEMRRMRSRRGDVTKAEALELRGQAIFEALGIERHDTGRTRSTGANMFGLSTREREVLTLLGEGKRNDEIAERLSISSGTVERHLANIYDKMGVANRTEAVSVAMREGLLLSLEATTSYSFSSNGRRPPARTLRR